MPVILTPVTPSAPSAASAVVDGAPTQLWRCDLRGRRRALEVQAGTVLSRTWGVLDSLGNPVDLSLLGAFDGSDASEITVRVREAIDVGGTTPRLDIAATVADPGVGRVLFPVGTDLSNVPGVYLAEVGVKDSSGVLVLTNQFYLVVNRGLFTPDTCAPVGMLTLAELRLHLWDSDPGENSLLDTVQFDAAQLALAIERPVLYWNEAQPPIDQRYTTVTFPYRYYWLEGAVAQLYIGAAHWYRRNHLPYQAGGLAVDDLGKAKEYEEIGQQKWGEYRDWVRQKKVGINCENAIQSSFSPYAYRGYY